MIKNNTVDSAVVKLTLWYAVIVFVLSLGFSLVFYQIYRGELAGDLRQPVFSTIQQPIDFIHNYEDLRAKQLDASLSSIRFNLVLLNIGMLFAGGVVGYFLARRSLQPVAAAMEAKTRFTADASHELRTPLTVMQTEIEVTLRDKNLTLQRAQQQLKSNLEEIAKLKTLSEGLLQLSEAENGQVMPTKLVNISKILEAAVNSQKNALKLKHLDLQIQVDPVQIVANRQRLLELVIILLDNAIKYSPANSKIILSSKQQADWVTISVKDNGQGIAATDLPFVFDRFYRSDKARSKTTVSGYGLGLAIAKQIVDVHNGSITVKSATGKGSEFIVKLPSR